MGRLRLLNGAVGSMKQVGVGRHCQYSPGWLLSVLELDGEWPQWGSQSAARSSTSERQLTCTNCGEDRPLPTQSRGSKSQIMRIRRKRLRFSKQERNSH